MGEIIGGMLAIYLVGKVLELAILKRVISSFATMAFTSSVLVFLVILVLWLVNRDQPYAFRPAMLVSYFLAAVILPAIRIMWNKRQAAKAAKAV